MQRKAQRNLAERDGLRNRHSATKTLKSTNIWYGHHPAPQNLGHRIWAMGYTFLPCEARPGKAVSTARRLKTLNGVRPQHHSCEFRTSELDRSSLDLIIHMPRLNGRSCKARSKPRSVHFRVKPNVVRRLIFLAQTGAFLRIPLNDLFMW